MAHREGEVAALLRRVFLRAVRTFDVAALVRSRLVGRPRGRVLAVGKAAATMLGAAWDDSVERALLVLPDGARVAWAAANVEVHFANHPEPSAASVEAADAALAFAQHGIDLALISGGSSALLVKPALGLDLELKLATLAALARAGAPIKSLNLVRRHLSMLKGGGLARVNARPLTTLILSDVIGGQAHDVGSGPTVADPTTCDEARAVLDRYALACPVSETLKPGEADALGLWAEVLAGPEQLAEFVASLLEAEGFEVHRMPAFEGDVVDAAQRYIGMSTQLLPGQALVRAAEPTHKLSARVGRGGRSTHVAACAGPRLAPNVALLCASSDGVDGSSGGAGAVVMQDTLPEDEIREALARFDTGRLHARCGSLIDAGGPTGLNLCDVHVLARAR